MTCRDRIDRVFAATPGETVAEAVRRAQLNRAAVLVVSIETWTDRTAAAQPHAGPCPQIGASFGRLAD